jgi:uncharacterized membrane protein YqhA
VPFAVRRPHTGLDRALESSVTACFGGVVVSGTSPLGKCADVNGPPGNQETAAGRPGDTAGRAVDSDTDPPDGPRTARIQGRFERLLALSRLLTLIPVIFLLLDAAGSFVYGADILVRTADGDIGEPARIGGRLGIFLIVMDTFLVGATLMIAAFGFYELFVIRKERARHSYWLPSWLRMRDLEDLKARVVSMLILVAAITFVDITVESHDERGILFLGLGIAVVIIALTAFLRFGRRPDVVTAPAPPGPPAPPALGPAPPAPAPAPRGASAVRAEFEKPAKPGLPAGKYPI